MKERKFLTMSPAQKQQWHYAQARAWRKKRERGLYKTANVTPETVASHALLGGMIGYLGSGGPLSKLIVGRKTARRFIVAGAGAGALLSLAKSPHFAKVSKILDEKRKKKEKKNIIKQAAIGGVLGSTYGGFHDWRKAFHSSYQNPLAEKAIELVPSGKDFAVPGRLKKLAMGASKFTSRRRGLLTGLAVGGTVGAGMGLLENRMGRIKKYISKDEMKRKKK